ncbi:MAG TPA: peptidylprolyl isomerase [Sphingobium sp.]|jgi:peptidyl-prolyl cis-trans isomerase D|uniref:SurA N-terminal domain-containing protein n=1 Tax=unclassified Sphingobium TaxID=2611147 RepID=UPI0007F3D789|nr:MULTISPECIES: SurA N-terminal domain-containing protein [unclassified Sphingobium]OAN53300.1 peptidylprolyl isomerase [Sphingobium sp. TCM1]WIW87310.1 SurA N-terminal domain-containing protein [Sphingobium sp. V4]HAF42424.1 peptidylprolyl isomerase [Sphingobium sp.]
MLSVFRSFIRSKFGALFAILFLGVIAAAFILGDLTSGQFGNSLGGGGTAASAKGHKLSQGEFQDRVQRVFENARRSNPGLQIADFFAQGGAAQVYDQLVASLTLRAFADDQGVHISKRLVDAQIAQIPAFQDAAGNFSQENFRQLLIRERLTEQALRDDISREILQRQLLAPIGLGARPSETLVLPYASLLLEARQGTVAAIPAVAFLDEKSPTDAQLADYYRKNSARFTIPEQRRIRYAVVDAARFAQASQPSEAEIAGYYNQNKAAYAAKQNRSIEQLVLPTQAGAKAIADQVKAGKTLAVAAQGAGLAVSTAADQSREALTASASKAVADAAFAARQGELVGPVRGSLGWLLLRVTAINETPARPLAAVRGEIVETLRAQKEKQLLADFTGKLEDQIADGGTFEEVVKDNGLTLATSPALLSTGKQVRDQAYVVPADIQPLIAPVFAMSADDDAQLVPITPDKRYALVAPGEIIAAAPPPLAEVKQLVLAQYKLNAGNQKAKALAEQIQAKVAKGAKLADAIAQAGVKLPAPQVLGGRRADIMRGEQRPPAEVAILFSMAANTVKTLPIGQDRGYFVVQLNKIERGDAKGQPQLLAQVRDQLGEVIGQEYGQQFERAVEKQLDVTRNANAVAQVRQALAATNSGDQ